ncbi:MAG: heavy metal translocating P-type ATPase [Clostridia bacterium]|nr:heavy metal translocating P-type ATPase [Clostridia bacterium]
MSKIANYTLSRKDKVQLTRIIASLGLFIPLIIVDKIYNIGSLTQFGWILPLILYSVIYILIGYDVLARAGRNIINFNPLDENFLMSIATLGAFALAIYKGVKGEATEGFDEGCAVLIFYQVGEFFQQLATERSRNSISSLMDIRPDSANVIREGGVINVYPEDIKIGEIIIVKPGERVPLDGIVVKGCSTLDTMALTGESAPSDVYEGQEIMSGCINLTSTIEIKVNKEFYDSTVSRILDLVESAADKKSKTEAFITRFARWYTPIVVGLALCLALIPSIFNGNTEEWIYRALNFLVVSCPCAIVISVPMTFFVGIGVASRNFILVKGSNHLEKLSRVNTFVFDKTGTVTTGKFKVESVYPLENREEILHLAALAEQDSLHPIAISILEEYGKETEKGYTIENKAGYGIIAKKGENVILCGNNKLLELYNTPCKVTENEKTTVHVAKNREYVGTIYVSDRIKDGTKAAIAELQNMGSKCVMLTGDKEKIAQKVASSIGISEYKSSLLPQDKVSEVEKLIDSKNDGLVCFVGDGINDAPVLMRADVGVSMGAIGSDSAIESSDIVLMKDDLTALPLAKRIASKTVKIARQNIVFPLLVKVAILVLSAIGIANMWMAVFGDVGVAVLAILNAMRTSKIK